MSNDWDVITNAVKHAVGLATNPGWELGRVIDDLVTGDGPFTRTVPGEPRPASPSAPSGTGGALPPAPQPLPPPPGGSSSGAAAEASQAAADQVKALLSDLAELDKNAAATVAAIHAAGQAGAQALDDIQKGVEAKIAELGPRLETPAGQQELRNYLTEKLTAAKTVLETQMAEAEDSARKTQDITHKYSELAAGGGAGGASGPAPSTGGGGANGGGSAPVEPANAAGESGQGAAPAAATPTTAAAQPAGLMPGMGMMPGGMGMPSIPMPSLGGMPGLGGGGDPLGALGGLSGLGAHDTPAVDSAFHDDASDGARDSSSGEAKLHDDSTQGADHRDAKLSDDAGTQPAAAEHGDGANRTDADSGQSSSASDGAGDHPAASSAGQQTGTHLTLPDGTTTDARNDASASAVRAALNGTPVADAYRQAGVELPPPGTPVTDPLPPTQLKAGDIGVWKDHMVMALGGGKVLVSGQVQPQSSLGSGPDFLGWINPTAHAPGAVDQPVTPTSVTPAGTNPPPAPPSPGAPA